MAPKGRARRTRPPRISTTASSPPAIKPRKPRKPPSNPKNLEISAVSPPSTLPPLGAEPPPAKTGHVCSTPKARRFRIPATETCPPAPKKQRPASKNACFRRKHIAFFSHPDIELFFNMAFRAISA
ncbi:hypothetical protein SAY86_008444 [Trapa natans]|uniref:Uncharacterized protein n=1 Tax=Trapa natans TaxID=22666 RepID=A0AAN7QAP2_TRANT|nr:hypothetical protein SAY86_008444 [Trapa natans]